MTRGSDRAGCWFEPRSAETGKVCELAMQELWLTGKILPVGAQLTVRHTFRSGEEDPLEVIYAFGLPRDAALRRFRVAGEDFSVRSELMAVEEAEQKYEEAIEEGHLAARVRQYADGVVNLDVGNVRPGETVTVYLEIVAGVSLRDDGYRFRFPFALAATYHERAKAIEVEKGQGEIELPAAEFGDVVLPQWVDDGESLHRVGFSLTVEGSGGAAEIASPSHPVRVVSGGDANAIVSLATEGDIPDRDLVLDVKHRDTSAQVFAGIDAEGTGRFAAVIPSSAFGEAPEEPRRVVLVIDRSGSMEGAPMQQALRAARACLGGLSTDDRFGIVAFDNEVGMTGRRLSRGDAAGRAQAERFLGGIEARGGTELARGLQEATRLLGGEGGDIFLLTDGQVSGTGGILREAKKAGIRIHCLGIGSASQDRFLALLASETGGTSRMVMPRERVDTAAVELFAAAGKPVASHVRAEIVGLEEAELAPLPPETVFEGMPLVLFGSTVGAGEGRLRTSWLDGGVRKELSLSMAVRADSFGELLCLLQGAKLLTRLDGQYASANGNTALERRRQSRIARTLEKLSREYGLASRRMVLVAVVERPGDAAGQVPETQVVPVGMPQSTKFSSYFGSYLRIFDCRSRVALLEPQFDMAPGVSECRSDFSPLERSVSGAGSATDEVLLELAGRIEADGGLAGASLEDRVLASLVTLLLLSSEVQAGRRGAFDAHSQRLLSFVRSADLSGFDEELRSTIPRVLAKLTRGEAVKADDWLDLGRHYLAFGQLSPGIVLSCLLRLCPPMGQGGVPAGVEKRPTALGKRLDFPLPQPDVTATTSVMPDSSSPKPLVDRLKDVGWFLFVGCVAVVVFGLLLVTWGDTWAALRLISKGKFAELASLLGQNALRVGLGTALTAASFGSMWLLLKLGDWADRRRASTRSTAVKALCWGVLVIVLCCWVVFLLVFLESSV